MLYFTIYDSRSSPACFNVDHAAIVRSKTTVTVMVFHGGVCHPFVQNSPALTVIDRRCKWCFVILEVPRCNVVFFTANLVDLTIKVSMPNYRSEHSTIRTSAPGSSVEDQSSHPDFWSAPRYLWYNHPHFYTRYAVHQSTWFPIHFATQLQLLSSNKILFEYHTLVKSFAITIAIYVPHHIGRNRKAPCASTLRFLNYGPFRQFVD